MITNTFTAERHFDSLYKNDRERAMINMINDEHDDDNQYADITDALSSAFDWTDSNEGYMYWLEVYDALQSGTYDVLRADQKAAEYWWNDDDTMTNEGLNILKEWASEATEEKTAPLPTDAAKRNPLPTDDAERKKTVLFSGFFAYFPHAIAAVARHSYNGSKKHNPDEPVKWTRSKSNDHADALLRHLMEKDYVAVVWRALALLQEHIEQQMAKKKTKKYFWHDDSDEY